MMKQTYPALTQFVGAYFHQNFNLQFGNPDGAIAAFMTGTSKVSIRAVCIELQQGHPINGKDGRPREVPVASLWVLLSSKCRWPNSADRSLNLPKRASHALAN